VASRRNLPSDQAYERFVNWVGYTILALAVAAGVPMGIHLLWPAVPFAAEMVILGILAIPVFVCQAMVWRQLGLSIRLRRTERERGQIIYTNRLGRFMDEHPYSLGFGIAGVGIVIAALWTISAHK
jgi:hypothetical protein